MRGLAFDAVDPSIVTRWETTSTTHTVLKRMLHKYDTRVIWVNDEEESKVSGEAENVVLGCH